MTGSKCDSCGAPLNFALGSCAYCGTKITSKFGQAFPVRCPWNGTKTCGPVMRETWATTGARSTEDSGIHCAHCHAPEPHPMSPEGALIHAEHREVGGNVEAVCPSCFKTARLDTLELDWPQHEAGDGNPYGYTTGARWHPYDWACCGVCRDKFTPEAKAWIEAANKERAKTEGETKSRDEPKSLVKEPGPVRPKSWFARRREAGKAGPV